MTTTPHDQPRRPHRAGWAPFIRHYLEMVLAMAIGMVALMPLEMWAVQAADAPHLLDRVEVMTLVMATDMAIAMGTWMAFRGHGLRDIAEMSAAMYLPFVIFFPATVTGIMTGGTMVVAGHALMLVAMLAVMLWRRDHYCHRRPVRPAAQAAEPGAPGTAGPAPQRTGAEAPHAQTAWPQFSEHRIGTAFPPHGRGRC
jgi:flagellar biosynthetic protein FliP